MSWSNKGSLHSNWKGRGSFCKLSLDKFTSDLYLISPVQTALRTNLESSRAHFGRSPNLIAWQNFIESPCRLLNSVSHILVSNIDLSKEVPKEKTLLDCVDRSKIHLKMKWKKSWTWHGQKENTIFSLCLEITTKNNKILYLLFYVFLNATETRSTLDNAINGPTSLERTKTIMYNRNLTMIDSWEKRRLILWRKKIWAEP